MPVRSTSKIQQLRQLPWGRIPIFRQAKKEVRFAGRAIKSIGLKPLLPAFVGYRMAQGRNLAQGLMFGGAETLALGGGLVGQNIGRMATKGAGQATKYIGGRIAGKIVRATAGRKAGVALGRAFQTAGSVIGTVFGGPVGRIIGSIGGGIVGYMATNTMTNLGFSTPEAPAFKDVYLNQRALTMRQASMMELAKTTRAAFGNEAQLMHLR